MDIKLACARYVENALKNGVYIPPTTMELKQHAIFNNSVTTFETLLRENSFGRTKYEQLENLILWVSRILEKEHINLANPPKELLLHLMNQIVELVHSMPLQADKALNFIRIFSVYRLSKMENYFLVLMKRILSRQELTIEQFAPFFKNYPVKNSQEKELFLKEYFKENQKAFADFAKDPLNKRNIDRVNRLYAAFACYYENPEFITPDMRRVLEEFRDSKSLDKFPDLDKVKKRIDAILNNCKDELKMSFFLPLLSP